jgi:hypothetical protein
MFVDLYIIDFILALLLIGMNLDAIKHKMNSVKNYHGRYSPGTQKERFTYLGVPIIQGLSLRN